MQLLHCDAPLGSRDFARTYIWLLWVMALAIDPLTDLALLPAVSFEPAGLAAMVPAVGRQMLLSPTGLLLLQLASIAATGLAALDFGGARWQGRMNGLGAMAPRKLLNRKLVSLAACVLLTVYQGVVRGFGHINHAEIVLLFAAYIVTWADWVDVAACNGLAEHGGSARGRKHFAGAPLTAIAAMLCVTYTLTGVHRVMQGGVEVFAGNHLQSWIICAQYSPRGYDLTLGKWLLSFPAFRWSMAVGFPLVTLFEILAPLCLVSKRFRLVFFAVMAPFHGLVLVTMGIVFWQSLALYVFLLDTPFWWIVATIPQKIAGQPRSFAALPDRKLAADSQ